MANTNALRDDNRFPCALATSSADGVTTLPIRVDPATGRVIMDITLIGTTSVPTLNSTIPDDENRIPVGSAVTDNSSFTPTPFLISSSNGFLLLDVVIE